MVAVANPAGNIPVVNGALPCEGTKALPLTLDFGVTNAYQVDLTAQYNQKQFSTLQTVWIDNADSDSSLTINCDTTAQRIICPPGVQGFFAMLLPVPPKFTVESDGGVAVQIILLNFYIPPTTWEEQPRSAGGLPQVDVPALDAVISGGGVNVNASPFTITGVTDASAAIVAGGTWQDLFVANAARKRFVISNPDTATETLYFRFNGGGAIPMLPGGGWDESGSSVVGDLVQVMAATTGHAFTAYNK